MISRKIAQRAFLLIWAVVFFTFSAGLFSEEVYSFIHAYFYWFFLLAVIAICLAALMMKTSWAEAIRHARSQTKSITHDTGDA